MDELIWASASSLAGMIRERRVAAVEVVAALLSRIEQVNGELNAVVQLAAQRARTEAEAADAQLARGETRGPLHGVPITIKDSLDTAGIVSTGGTTGRREFVPDHDATVVRRLRDAGAIVLGKTNTPELTLARGFETDNEVYGRTNNPFDVARTSGGSSGGAAAIIAAGGSPLDIGSDTGGSIRVPAHCCGITGLRPTSGRVPRTGHIVPYGARLVGFAHHAGADGARGGGPGAYRCRSSAAWTGAIRRWSRCRWGTPRRSTLQDCALRSSSITALSLRPRRRRRRSSVSRTH